MRLFQTSTKNNHLCLMYPEMLIRHFEFKGEQFKTFSSEQKQV